MPQAGLRTTRTHCPYCSLQCGVALTAGDRPATLVPLDFLDRLKAVLLDDADGIVANLDAGIQRSIDAYADPWGQDAKEPATPGQFRPSLPLIELPKVPVR